MEKVSDIGGNLKQLVRKASLQGSHTQCQSILHMDQK